jgi:cobalt-zinc-cadmium efflux system protein
MHAHNNCSHDHAAKSSGNPSADARERSRARERQKLMLTIGVTAAILVAEVIGGLISHSLSLLSDAGHMFSDVVAQALSLIALYIATRPKDDRRTYGWYRIEILAALLNGITLFVLAGFILWQGALRLRAPVEIQTPVMMLIASIGLIANLIGAWLLHDLKSLNARGAYLHIVFDLVSSVGVLLAGGVMWLAHGLYWLDPVLSMAIGVIILYSAYRLVREAVDVLLEAVPSGIDLAGVTHAIDRVPGVSQVHDLHIWTITSGLYALSAHIVVAAGHGKDNDELLNRVKEMLMRDFEIAHTTLQLESSAYEHVGHVC